MRWPQEIYSSKRMHRRCNFSKRKFLGSFLSFCVQSWFSCMLIWHRSRPALLPRLDKLGWNEVYEGSLPHEGDVKKKNADQCVRNHLGLVRRFHFGQFHISDDKRFEKNGCFWYLPNNLRGTCRTYRCPETSNWDGWSFILFCVHYWAMVWMDPMRYYDFKSSFVINIATWEN